jgi:PadR family transcriptional regulator, regulatory protein AphA
LNVKELCLGALTFGDASGYDLKKFFEQTFSHFCVAGFGSIYPALAELTAEGLVTCSDEPQHGKPDRRVYRLTDAGRAAFVRDLETTEPQHKVKSDFLLMMYFAHLLSPERLETLLDSRILELDRQLTLVKEAQTKVAAACQHAAGAEFVHGFGTAVMTAARDYLKSQRDQLAAAISKQRELSQSHHADNTNSIHTASRH